MIFLYIAIAAAISILLIYLQLKYLISFKVYLINIVLGAVVLIGMNYFSQLVGYNLFSLSACAVFGLPGILFIIFLKLLQ